MAVKYMHTISLTFAVTLHHRHKLSYGYILSFYNKQLQKWEICNIKKIPVKQLIHLEFLLSLRICLYN